MIYWNKHTTTKNAPISLTMLSLSISCSSQLVPSGVVWAPSSELLIDDCRRDRGPPPPLPPAPLPPFLCVRWCLGVSREAAGAVGTAGADIQSDGSELSESLRSVRSRRCRWLRGPAPASRRCRFSPDHSSVLSGG